MRTTVTIDDGLFQKAADLTGISEPATLLREGLLALYSGGERAAACGIGRHRSRCYCGPEAEGVLVVIHGAR